MQGGMNTQMSQGHYMGAPSGPFPGPPSSGGPPMYPQGRGFNRPQMMQGYNNPFQQVSLHTLLLLFSILVTVLNNYM